MASTVRMNQDGWTMIRDFRFFRNLCGKAEEARWALGGQPWGGRGPQVLPPLDPRRCHDFTGGGRVSVKLSPLVEPANGRAGSLLHGSRSFWLHGHTTSRS